MTLGLILADLGERKLEEDRPRNCQKVDLWGGKKVNFIEIEMWQTKPNGPGKIEDYFVKVRCKRYESLTGQPHPARSFIQHLRAPQNSFAINILFS